MKIRICKFFKFILIFYLIVISKLTFGQYLEEQKQITTFSSRIKNPIKIDVKANDKRIIFSANNSSFYNYLICLKFDKIINLKPYITTKEFLVTPGIHYLFEFEKNDQSNYYDYSYTFSYKIDLKESHAQLDHQYLIPVGDDRIVEIDEDVYLMDGQSLISRFRLDKGDTVFAMRKGYVTAVPNVEYREFDRISKYRSIEVIHLDGTIAIYEGIDSSNIFISPGHFIYPGEPIAIVNSQNSFLKVLLYNVISDITFITIPIKYYVDDGRCLLFNELDNTRVKYPENLMIKELNKGELKKYKKGRLFKKNYQG